MVALPAYMYVHHMHLVYGEAGVGHKCPELELQLVLYQHEGVRNLT